MLNTWNHIEFMCRRPICTTDRDLQPISQCCSYARMFCLYFSFHPFSFNIIMVVVWSIIHFIDYNNVLVILDFLSSFPFVCVAFLHSWLWSRECVLKTIDISAITASYLCIFHWDRELCSDAFYAWFYFLPFCKAQNESFFWFDIGFIIMPCIFWFNLSLETSLLFVYVDQAVHAGTDYGFEKYTCIL